MIYINEEKTTYIIHNDDGTSTYIPIEDGNKECEEIKIYIANGGEVLPQFTQDELDTATLEEKKNKLKEEMNALVSDMTMPEAMLLMLQYGMAKMNPDASDEPTPTKPLTPTGEDLITWGDNLAIELEAKILELRSL